MAVITVTIVSSILFFYRANRDTLEQSFQLDSGRRGVEALVRDLRETTNGDNGAYPLAAIASTSITFYSDIDQDQNVEKITYALTGTTFTRHVLNSSGSPLAYTGSGATSTVSTYVRNIEQGRPIFRYYDSAGAEITNYTQFLKVRFVSVTLIVNIEPSRGPEEFSLRSSAMLRNLRQ